MARSIKKSPEALPPLLHHLVEVLKEQESSDRPGEAAALQAFGGLALVQVPSRGVFAPKEGELQEAIDQIAKKHLGLQKPQQTFFRATAAVEPFSKRDEIESAANHLQTISDLAYFYVGLAFGITFADFAIRR
jgi:hypothetical protein